jgi:hypothetical protein
MESWSHRGGSIRAATWKALRVNERKGEDKGRFAKTLGGVAGRRVTYDELTGKATAETAETSQK